MESLNCKKCKTDKPVDEFYNDNRNNTGKSSICKQCQKSYKRNNGFKSGRLYKCKTCEEKLPITEFKTFEKGGRTRSCNYCTKYNIEDRMFELWKTKNIEEVNKFLTNQREVTGIYGGEDLLKKYENPK